MAQAQKEIDALTVLPDLVSGNPGLPQTTDSAFLVWRQTALAHERLTSAVELYNQDGLLVSRFALNIPEYTVAAQTAPTGSSCDWDLFGEAAPIGSEERRMLHAERRICVSSDEGGAPSVAGTIVLHVVFDYRTLPFITSQSPYFELFRGTASGAPAEASAGGEVEIAIYGWGLQPLYTSIPSPWPIDDALFARLYGSREPFWTIIQRGGTRHRVHFSNDRAGIFAIGYPVLSFFDHLVHLAELTTLAGAGFVLVLVGTAVFTRLAPRAAASRTRAAARDPGQLLPQAVSRVRAGGDHSRPDAGASSSASTSRTCCSSMSRRRRRAPPPSRDGSSRNPMCCRGGAPTPSGALNDDIMVWIRQVIDQDVNIFDGPRLAATSERDLFASGLLPTRTPDDVYRAIVLERRPELRQHGSHRHVTVSHCRGAGPRAGAGRVADGSARAAAAGDGSGNR